MKTKPYLLSAIAFLVWAMPTRAASVFDQESTVLIEGSSALVQDFQPMGQSFTPTLSSIDFVELNLFDADALNHAGATVLVNVRSDSITGTVLGSSLGMFLPDGFFGITSFVFASPVALSPGTTYYLQPVIQSGDSISSLVTSGYAGGVNFFQGNPVPSRDLWFREGVIPEPSVASLLAIACAMLAIRHRGKHPAYEGT